jgi:hypothetical protein
MAQDKTTKSGKKAAGIPLETVSPPGHEELEERIAQEALGDGAAAEPLTPRKEDKEPPQRENPKHPGRTSQE